MGIQKPLQVSKTKFYDFSMTFHDGNVSISMILLAIFLDSNHCSEKLMLQNNGLLLPLQPSAPPTLFGQLISMTFP